MTSRLESYREIVTMHYYVTIAIALVFLMTSFLNGCATKKAGDRNLYIINDSSIIFTQWEIPSLPDGYIAISKGAYMEMTESVLGCELSGPSF